MTTATSIRLDPQLKENLKILAKQMGLSFSALVNASLRQTLEKRSIEISAPLPVKTMNPEYEQELMNDPDAKETVFVANNRQDIDKFFETLSY